MVVTRTIKPRQSADAYGLVSSVAILA